MSYHRDLGDAAFDAYVAFVKKCNDAGKKVLAPLSSQIDALPIPRAMKLKLKNQPFEAILDLYDPLEDAIERVTKKINEKTGKKRRSVFGTTVDMTVDPASDKKLDPVARNLLRRLRSANHFIALFWTEPLLLAIGMAKEGFDFVESMGTTLGKALGMHPAQAKAAARLAMTATPAVGVDWMANAVGLGITGAEDAAVAGGGTAAAGGTATVGGVVLPPWLNQIMLDIVTKLAKAGIESAGKATVSLAEQGAKTLTSGGEKPVQKKATTPLGPTVITRHVAPNRTPLLLLGAGAVVAAVLLLK